MRTAVFKVVWAVGLLGVNSVALAGVPKPSTPHEPIGFVTGTVIGAFAAGPVGAFVGAGLGIWLGHSVHRASDATKAEAQVAALQADKSVLSESNRSLTAQLDDLDHKVETAQNSKEEATGVLDGLQGDVLFRTGSAEITPEIAHQVQMLAHAVAQTSTLKVRVDGYADPRGTAENNLKLSQARANSVRDLFLASGIRDEALEVNAYGMSQSIADDEDGYALERRVRLTLQAQGGAAVVRAHRSD